MRPYAVLPTALLALILAATPASAYVVSKKGVMAPERVAAELTGEGENMEIVANLEIPGAEEIELAGNYAFVSSSAGLTVVDIRDPKAPFVAGVGDCEGGFGDVGVNGAATIAILGTDGTAPACAEGTSDGGTVIFDISNKTQPKFLSYVPAATGSHTTTIDGSLLTINNYDPDYRISELYDISDPAKPRKISELVFNGTGSHDSYIDHRPDGKVLLYSASVASHDIFDITDPSKPLTLQKVRDNQVSISHQVEPNFKRDVLIATDEWGGGAASGVCGKSPTADPTYQLGGVGTAAQGTGFVHFYKAAADGTFSLNGVEKLGTYNVPITPEPGGCTSHVFWQAADQNRLSIAWYAMGSRVVDFSDPAQAKELGWFIPTGANTWSAKPHNGYIFSSDLSRGMDVMRYTGEGGKGWPATSGPAELQRFGVTKVPANAPTLPPATPRPPDSRAIGTFKAATKLKVPGKKGKKTKLTFTATDKDGVVVAKLRFAKKASRKTAFKVSGSAVAGTYRYVVRVGDRGKVLKRGKLVVKAKSGSSLAPNSTFVCRIG